jgi:hypothetical protein
MPRPPSDLSDRTVATSLPARAEGRFAREAEKSTRSELARELILEAMAARGWL